MVSGYPTSTIFPRVDGWLTDPQVLGRHNFYLFSWSHNDMSDFSPTMAHQYIERTQEDMAVVEALSSFTS